MTKPLLTACCLLVLALGGAGTADEDPVVLKYKFVAGQTHAFEVTGSGTLPMTLNTGPDMGDMAIALDMKLDLSLAFRQLCQSVDEDGSGHLDTTLPRMTMRMSMDTGPQPMDVLVDWDKGQLVTTMNGQTMPADEGQQKLQKMLATALKSIVSPVGAGRLDPETAKLLGPMASFPMGGISASVTNLNGGFVETPVKPGDTWTLALKPEESGGALEGTGEYKLVKYEEVEGVRCARIEGQARFRSVQPLKDVAMGMPGQMTINSMELAVAFINWFDPVAGVMVVSKSNLVQNMTMVVAMAGMGGAQGVNLPLTIENSQMTFEVRRPKPQ